MENFHENMLASKTKECKMHCFHRSDQRAMTCKEIDNNRSININTHIHNLVITKMHIDKTCLLTMFKVIQHI